MVSDLFDNPSDASEIQHPRSTPLADRMRPRSLDEIVGQEEVLGPSSALRRSMRGGLLPSLILWGPPGCGKTTLAACLAHQVKAPFLPYSAVNIGVKELKNAMTEASRLRQMDGRTAVLFLDEIHRFNKAQQDALLPRVEAGDVIFIGATTENPSFEVNSALLSRCRVIILQALSESSLVQILRRAIETEKGLGPMNLQVSNEVLGLLARRCNGDARFALGSLELAASAAMDTCPQNAPPVIEEDLARQILEQVHLIYDKAGEEHYNLISALHKSLRNSDAQAGIYWLGRMLESGEDPLYVARRLIRFASEDIGMADPQALVQCVSAQQAIHFLGMPEGALALSQAVIYLAQAPKSNALYMAYKEVQRAIGKGSREGVPLHLRNAPTELMKNVGYGEGYRYAHDEAEGVAPMDCLPSSLTGSIFYRPRSIGFETEAAERLRQAWRIAHRKQPASDDPNLSRSEKDDPS